MAAQPSHAERVLMEEFDYRVGRWDDRVRQVPSQVSDLVVASRQAPPFNEKVRCTTCGRDVYLTRKPPGSACGHCDRGVVEAVWTTHRAEHELLRSIQANAEIHIAFGVQQSVAFGLIEVQRCGLLELNGFVGEAVAGEVLRVMQAREGIAFIKHLALLEGAATLNVPKSLLTSVLRSWGDPILPVVIEVDPESIQALVCRELQLKVCKTLKGERGVLMAGKLQLRA